MPELNRSCEVRQITGRRDNTIFNDHKANQKVLRNISAQTEFIENPYFSRSIDQTLL